MDDDDFDTPWKEVVMCHFPEFMAFYFPLAHAAIDWSRPHVFLDQEFAALSRDAELGKRLLDKLVSVYLRDGGVQWLLVHVEVQGWRDARFAERMFVYNYRVYDRHHRAVASLALLTDDNRHWRPSSFGYRLLGCWMAIEFPVVKLVDFADHADELLRHDNPFALVTLAHLQARQTRGNAHRRRAAKLRLTRLLYQRDWDRQRIINLYRVIDWIMRLPQALEVRLSYVALQLERRRAMPYISSMERYCMERGHQQGLEKGLQEGRQKGLQEGRQKGWQEGRQEGRQEGQQEGQCVLLTELLQQRFGELDAVARARLAAADVSQLLVWAKNFVSAATLDEVFRNR
ncbi:transposase [Duganella sp. HH105]|uniref:transposase n=1 Tax=Duganella sp. HH105 TaxID=1781067 RepID=UPI000877B1BF|nr:transposase [Duganella sp. HH105]